MHLDAAIDDYLHLIVRTRPWTKKREAELLDAWSEWLNARTQEPIHLTPDARRLAAMYADETRLAPGRRSDLAEAVDRLCRWAEPRP